MSCVVKELETNDSITIFVPIIFVFILIMIGAGSHCTAREAQASLPSCCSLTPFPSSSVFITHLCSLVCMFLYEIYPEVELLGHRYKHFDFC